MPAVAARAYVSAAFLSGAHMLVMKQGCCLCAPHLGFLLVCSGSCRGLAGASRLTLDTAMLLVGPTMRARPKSAILTWKRGLSRSIVRSSSCRHSENSIMHSNKTMRHIAVHACCTRTLPHSLQMTQNTSDVSTGCHTSSARRTGPAMPKQQQCHNTAMPSYQ